MKQRRIGQTDITISEAAFGCASIGNLYRAVTDTDAAHVLQAAWDGGIRYFDTAPQYGRGLSERRLGRFLQTHPGAVVSTKVGRVLRPASSRIDEVDGFVNPDQNDVHYDYSGDGIEESLTQSMARLGREFIDIVYVHDIGELTHGSENDRHMADFLGSGYDRLVALKNAGRIGAFGLGVNECAVCLDVLAHGPLDAILLAGRLTLLDRSAEEALVPRCRETGTSLVLGGIFNSGILATGPIEGATLDYGPAPAEVLATVGALQKAAERAGLSLAEASIHFGRTHPAAASVLLGTAKVSSLERNLRYFSGEPAAEALAQISLDKCCL